MAESYRRAESLLKDMYYKISSKISFLGNDGWHLELFPNTEYLLLHLPLNSKEGIHYLEKNKNKGLLFVGTVSNISV